MAEALRSSEPFGFSRLRWEALAREWSVPEYRGRQIFDAIHGRSARTAGEIHEIPRDLRERLERELPMALPPIVSRQPSRDGSAKYALRLSDGALVEAVFMPGEAAVAQVNEFADARAAEPELEEAPAAVPATARSGSKFTVCLSSQTGCAVDCAFCVTGRLGGGRNLSAGEIVGQLYSVLGDRPRFPARSGETGAVDGNRGLSPTDGLRVVFMGMGEPFLNVSGVLGALEVLFEVLPPRRVTVSTSGITPAFAAFAALPRRPNLAVSINAADDETRNALMPINRTYPLAGLLDAIRVWPLEPRRRITVEYVLIAGRNDSAEEARRLARLLAGVRAKVNVIPLNEDPVYLPGWKRPSEETIGRFAGALASAGLPVTVRRSRGPDAAAACGQLKGRTVDPRKRPGRPAGAG